MPKLPVLSGRELIKILKKAGFEPVRRKGSHIILARYDKDGRVALVVPDHKEIDRGTLAEIIRQARLKRDEFLRLVK